MWTFNPSRHTESVDICIFVCFIWVSVHIVANSHGQPTNEYNNILDLARNRWISERFELYWSVYGCMEPNASMNAEVVRCVPVLFYIVQPCMYLWLTTCKEVYNFSLSNSNWNHPGKIENLYNIHNWSQFRIHLYLSGKPVLAA